MTFLALSNFFSGKLASQAADLILLDDEPYVIKVWQAFADDRGKRLVAFRDPHDFLRQIRSYGRDTQIFVDVQLKSDVSGIDVARKLVAQGFKAVYFTTSHPEIGLKGIAGIKGTIDKRFPSWIGEPTGPTPETPRPGVDNQSPAMAMRSFMLSSLMVHGVHAAARLRLADHLANGPLSIEDLAARADVNPDALARLVRALACVGVFAAEQDAKVSLTPMGATLKSDHPESLRNMALLIGEPFFSQAWTGLTDAVRTGGMAFDQVHGCGFFDYVTQRPQLSDEFNGWMVEVARIQAKAILDAYDFSVFERLVDVGGGYGGLLGEILTAHPKLHGTLLDLPTVVAKSSLKGDERFGARFDVQGGDFFKTVPSGGNAYLLKYILHDWSDADSIRILENCRRAFGSNSTLLIVDMIVPEGSGYHYSKLSDLNMMVLNRGGKERTRSEFTAILERSGFVVTRIVPTMSELSIIEAKRHEA